MTSKEFQKFLSSDPDALCKDDPSVVFEFNEVEGKTRMIDGVAAGGAWFGFLFLDGPYAGKTIFCEGNHIWEEDEVATFTYTAHCDDDGFQFNRNPTRKVKKSQSDSGGDYIPEFDGKTFTVKGDMTNE